MSKDLSVQATNNSSILSKRSVEEYYSSILYPYAHKRRYFSKFVPKCKRRSPVINRGYLLRILMFKQTLIDIVKTQGQTYDKIFVVNLGCGFDPLAFELLDNSEQIFGDLGDKLVFIDLDYKDLIRNKCQLIKQDEEFCNIIGNSETIEGYEYFNLNCDRYKSIECNLNKIEEFRKRVVNSNDLFDLKSRNSLKIFIAEVSISYMDPVKADRIINECKTLPCTHFMILEQLIPEHDMDNKFVKLMLRHFNKINSPILSVQEKYHTFDQQRKRFNNGKFDIMTVMEYWDKHITRHTKREIDLVEPFDEFEEFNLFCMHYYFGKWTNVSNDHCFATPDPSFKLMEKSVDEERNNLVVKEKTAGDIVSLTNQDKFQDSVNLQVSDFGVETRFLAGCTINRTPVINSGFSNKKLNTTRNATNGKEIEVASNSPIERLFHTFSSLDENRAILIGGRSSPTKIFADCWILSGSGKNENDEVSFVWSKYAELPDPRYRHNVVITQGYIVVIGGTLDAGKSVILASKINNSGRKDWQQIRSNLKPRLSSAACADENGTIYLMGGILDSAGTVDSTLYQLSLDFECREAKIVGTKFNLNLGRFGAKMTVIGNKLLVIGGCSNLEYIGRHNTIFFIDRQEVWHSDAGASNSIEKFSVDNWENFPLLVAGDLLKLTSKKYLYVGGAVVCYSFGSYWNKSLEISIGLQ